MNEIDVAATYEGLRVIGPWITSLTDSLDEVVATGLNTRAELAIHELATNSVDHSGSVSKTIVLRGELTSNSLRIELIDDGHPVDVEAIPLPDADEPQVRGYGMMIVEQLVASLDYQRANDRNTWIAVFDLSAEQPAPIES